MFNESTREVTYTARSREGMTPAEVTDALKGATTILRCRISLRGKILSLTVDEPWATDAP